MSQRGGGAFQARLQAVLRDGNLRLADLARWFNAPYPTVRGWVLDGRNPAGGPQDREHIHARLDVLEQWIKLRRGFPVPRMAPGERIEYLLKIGEEVRRLTHTPLPLGARPRGPRLLR